MGTDELPADAPVVLFDGVCNLCVGSVQFLLEHDDEEVLRFAALQSAAGAELLAQCGLSADNMDSIVLGEGEDCYTKSDAALRIAGHLGGGFRLATPLGLVPRRLRDAVYDVVAEHRYRWFGRREECLRPTPEREARFLE
jgi:predicted DCC family thiol-disulfide oxidoreductase YuxK